MEARKCVRLFLWISSMFALVTGTSKGCNKSETLYVQVIVSQESDFDFSGYIPAINLALDRINSNCSLLPDYNLKYTEIINSKCSDTPGVYGLIDHVTNPARNETKVIIIGADCSVSSQPIASLAHLWNLVQVSIDSSSPRLSDTKLYPSFVRPVPPDDSISSAVVALMKYFDWKHLAIITQEEDLFTLARDALVEAVKNNGLSTIHSSAFPTDSSPINVVESLQMSSGRIIFLNTYPGYALEILCQASTLGMTYPNYAWISFGWYFEAFWMGHYQNRSYEAVSHCTTQELMNIVKGMFMVNTYPELDETDSQVMIGDLNITGYEELYRHQWVKYFNHANFSSHPNETEKTAFGYDATWLAALALHGAEEELKDKSPPINLKNFTHSRSDAEDNYMIRSLIYSNALNTTFHGASGYLKVLSNGDRAPELTFSQYKQRGGTLKREKIGRVVSADTLNVYSSALPLFEGVVPKSHIHETIHLGLFISYTLLSVAGIVFAIVCMVFNLVYRNKQIVKLSSPYLNIFFITGTIMTYLLVIVLGIDYNLVSVNVMNGLCQPPIWIGVIAFTLIYGVVLAKTFKVYFIIKNLQVTRPDKKRVIQDWHMFLLMGILLGIDILFLIIITSIPQAILTVELVELPLVSGELPAEAYLCTSETSQIWGPILLVYKAVELVFSLIFAFETRKVKVKELNDSRMVIFSVYTIVVAGIAVAPVIVLLGNKLVVRYAVTGIICLATATVLLAINFIPKMYSLRRHPSGEKAMDFTSLVKPDMIRRSSNSSNKEGDCAIVKSRSKLETIPEDKHCSSVLGNDGCDNALQDSSKM